MIKKILKELYWIEDQLCTQETYCNTDGITNYRPDSNECSAKQHLQLQMAATLLKSLNFEIQKSRNETLVNCI